MRYDIYIYASLGFKGLIGVKPDDGGFWPKHVVS